MQNHERTSRPRCPTKPDAPEPKASRLQARVAICAKVSTEHVKGPYGRNLTRETLRRSTRTVHVKPQHLRDISMRGVLIADEVDLQLPTHICPAVCLGAIADPVLPIDSPEAKRGPSIRVLVSGPDCEMASLFIEVCETKRLHCEARANGREELLHRWWKLGDRLGLLVADLADRWTLEMLAKHTALSTPLRGNLLQA